jgi:hypothetical protein
MASSKVSFSSYSASAEYYTTHNCASIFLGSAYFSDILAAVKTDIYILSEDVKRADKTFKGQRQFTYAKTILDGLVELGIPELLEICETVNSFKGKDFARALDLQLGKLSKRTKETFDIRYDIHINDLKTSALEDMKIVPLFKALRLALADLFGTIAQTYNVSEFDIESATYDVKGVATTSAEFKRYMNALTDAYGFFCNNINPTLDEFRDIVSAAIDASKKRIEAMNIEYEQRNNKRETSRHRSDEKKQEAHEAKLRAWEEERAQKQAALGPTPQQRIRDATARLKEIETAKSQPRAEKVVVATVWKKPATAPVAVAPVAVAPVAVAPVETAPEEEEELVKVVAKSKKVTVGGRTTRIKVKA